MCKVFKIKTSSGLVTQTTDPEIVRCLLDNYDGELSIETKKKQVCDKSPLISSENTPSISTKISEPPDEDECCRIINVQPFLHEKAKYAYYVKALRNALNIRLDVAKEYADNGFKMPINAKTLFNGLVGLLNAFHVQYTIENN